jgi:hypothetical protein
VTTAGQDGPSGVSEDALVAAPSRAQVRGFVTPWVGVTAGSTSFGSNSGNQGRSSFGISAAAMANGLIGGEADFGYGRRFFGTENEFGGNSVTGMTGNLLVGVPVGGTHQLSVRPYVLGGVGLIHTRIDGGTLFAGSSSNNDFVNDLDLGRLHFWRTSVGLVLR